MSRIKFIEGIKKAIETKDLSEFRHNHYELVNLCRKHLFENNKPVLEEIDRDISSIMLRFYKTGSPEWPEVDRMMGGLEVLQSFIGEQLHTESNREILEKVSKSNHDRIILKTLPFSGLPVRSGELAEKTGLGQNSLTNRFPGLEKRGLIVRSRSGKNSFIYLTPRGKDIAENLEEKSMKDISTPETFIEPNYIEKKSSENPIFWTIN